MLLSLVSSGGNPIAAPIEHPHGGHHYPGREDIPYYDHYDGHLTHASHPARHFDHPPAHEQEYHHPEHLYDPFGREFSFVPEHNDHDEDYYMPHMHEHEMYSHY